MTICCTLRYIYICTTAWHFDLPMLWNRIVVVIYVIIAQLVVFAVIHNVFTLYSSVSTVRFNHSTYNVNENDGIVDVTLYHSNPSSINIMLRVNSSDVSTDSK